MTDDQAKGRADEPRVQRWLSRSAESDEPRSRLQKRDFRGAESAFFELAIESHFRARRVATSKPTLSSGRPDLLVHDASGDVYIEVATVFDTEVWEKAGRRAELIAASVQQIVSPYWINLHFREREIPTSVAPRRIRSFVTKVIEQTKAGRVPIEREHEIPGSGVSFNLWGEREEETMGIGFQRPEVRWLGGHVQVERAINDKAAKYPEIAAARAPYVVAICSGSWFAIGEEQVLSGVYGTVQVTIYVPRGPVSGPIPPPTSTRRGGMLAQRRDGEFSNREVSAVLYVWEDMTRRDRPLRAKVFHHPEPFVRLSETFFSDIPQTAFRRTDGESVAIEFGSEPTDFDVD